MPYALTWQNGFARQLSHVLRQCEPLDGGIQTRFYLDVIFSSFTRFYIVVPSRQKQLRPSLPDMFLICPPAWHSLFVWPRSQYQGEHLPLLVNFPEITSAHCNNFSIKFIVTRL